MNLAGLWFDDEKPTTSTFVCSLTLEMNSLYEKGNDICLVLPPTYIP